MIVDRLEYADRYVALHPCFGAAFRYLRTLAPAALADGRHEIVENELYAIVERAQGRGMEASRVEHHRRFVDIQYVVSGEEKIGWMPTSDCDRPEAPFDSDHDIGFYRDRPTSWFTIPAGSFAIFFPEDGHAPLAGETVVHKVVLKVAISLDQVLADLRSELAASDHLSPEHEARLKESITEVEEMIAGRQAVSDSFAGRFREMAQELEVTHPRLTHTVGRVADALAQIGI